LIRHLSGCDPTRRDLLKLTAATGDAVAAGPFLLAPRATAQSANAEVPQSANAAAAPLNVVLRVNGNEHRLTLDPRTTLLDVLPEHLRLTGRRKAVASGTAARARY
jgi:xanthine dehydrogenase YagT iron-sulfur-binding subunit